jgi:hypothetical protein
MEVGKSGPQIKWGKLMSTDLILTNSVCFPVVTAMTCYTNGKRGNTGSSIMATTEVLAYKQAHGDRYPFRIGCRLGQ